MNDEESKVSETEQRGLDRILALSDGVFAFAITLLVLGLTVPSIAEFGLSQSSLNLKLLESLSNELTAFTSFGISFVVISIWWVVHHRLFRYVRGYDAGLMWRNLFFLAVRYDNPLSGGADESVRKHRLSHYHLRWDSIGWRTGFERNLDPRLEESFLG